jgi:hypothetical protein
MFRRRLHALDCEFPLLRDSAALGPLAVDKLDRPPPARVFGTIARIMLGEAGVKILGDPGIQTSVGTLNDIDVPHGGCGADPGM